MATSTINNPNIYTKVWTVDLDSVSSANGAYSHNTTVPKMTTDYKPILFECDDPSIFKDTVNISTGQNTVTLSCNNVIGSTTGVKASFVLQGDADTLSSAEYQALGSRIGDLNNLTTSDKSSVVGAVNVLNSKAKLQLLGTGNTVNENWGVVVSNIMSYGYGEIVCVCYAENSNTAYKCVSWPVAWLYANTDYAHSVAISTWSGVGNAYLCIDNGDLKVSGLSLSVYAR